MATMSARGETARRIYNVLARYPDLTAAEIQQHIPELSLGAIGSALHKMRIRKAVEVHSKKPRPEHFGSGRQAYVYRLAYDPKTIARLKTQTEPVVKPVSEVDAAVLRHLTDIYKALTQMTDQQEALVGILKDTLIDLAETKDALEGAYADLEEAEARRNWWDAVKEWFA